MADLGKYVKGHKTMKIIQSQSLLERELSDIRIIPHTRLNLQGYKNLSYECGCGEAHFVNGMDGSLPILAAPPVKVLYHCRNGFLTFVHIKGIFSTTAVSLWACKQDLFENSST